MKKISMKLLSTMLALVMVFGLFVAMPQKVKAATPAVIDISRLTVNDESSPTGVDQWRYDGEGRELHLLGEGGTYTLTGNNTNLRIDTVYNQTYGTHLNNINIILNNVNYSDLHDTHQSAFSIFTKSSYTLTLIGTNTITHKGNSVEWGVNSALSLFHGGTINGSGSLSLKSLNGYGMKTCDSIVRIVGSASVTTEGSEPVYSWTQDSFLLGDSASLTFKSTGIRDSSYAIGRAESGPSTQWSLTGNLTTTNPLINSSITVKLPAYGTGTIRRDTPGPATINIANLTSSNAINPPGQYAWAYNASSKQLSLYAPNSSYTLQGTNPGLSISVSNTADNANITLNGINCTGQGSNDTFSVRRNCTVTLQGTNSLTHNASNSTCAFVVFSGTCTVNGSGSLTASGGYGIYVTTTATLRITGTGTFTAVGKSYPVYTTGSGSLLLGDNASLAMTNNSGSVKTCTIGRANSGGSTQWRLTGSATTDDLLSASTISVSLPAGGSGSVLRLASATINIGNLTSTQSNTTGPDTWSYNHANRTLTLSSANGIYTLTGLNNNLNIEVDTAATNAKVTLNGVTSTAANGVAFSAYKNFTLTLTGTNTLTSNGGPAFSLIGNTSCTVNGTGNLTTTSVAASGPGIHLDSSATLCITGTASVTASGTSGPIDTTGSIQLGETASLTMTNKSSGARTRAVSIVPGSAGQWRLSGSATTTDALTAQTINVTVPAGGTGTVTRSKPSEINISTLSTSNVSSTAGFDAWNYNASARRLQLTAELGNYTLTGTNTDLVITVASSAVNAKVTLNNVTSRTSSNYTAFNCLSNSTVTLIGSNSLTTSISYGNGLYVSGNECTINGYDSLAVSGGDRGIYISSGSTLRITGSAAVTAIGSNGAVENDGRLLMGDYTKLTMTNYSNTANTCAIERADSGGSTLWMLSDSASTTDALSASLINVTIPANSTGTVRRSAPVCSIGSTQYPTLDSAIAAVPTGGSSPTVIKLLRHITHPDALLISNKKITFDLSGNNLTLQKQLSVVSGSVIDYTGTGEFKVAIDWSSDAAGATYHGLFITNSYARLTGVSINDIGTREDREVTAITANNNAVVEVNGDVKAISNGEDGSVGMGIYTFGAGTVNVSGNVTADTVGVWTCGPGDKVTVDGTIEAPAYIKIDISGTALTIDNNSLTNPKPGYLTYTNGSNTVWVKTYYICRVESTGIRYSTLDAAIAAVPEGGTGQTVISLLTSIMHPDPITISNKKITFDLRSHNLIIGNLLSVRDNSLVSYIGPGEFKVVCNMSSAGSYNSYNALDVFMNSIIQLTGVEITDTGSGTNWNSTAVRCDFGSTVLVDGDVKAIGNNATGSYGVGVSASDSGSTVTVAGNVIASDRGVTTGWGAQVTVDGTITAPAYIIIEGMTKTITDYEIYTTKPDYFTYASGMSTVWVKDPNPKTAISWVDVTANGTSGSVTTTQLTFTFSADPATLTVADITLFGAAKGTLSGTGTTRTLDITDITVANGGYVFVIINNPSGYVITPSDRYVEVFTTGITTAIIDIGDLTGANRNNPPGQYAWIYNAASRELSLTAPFGVYILTGTNPDLNINTEIATSITFNGMNCTSQSYIPFFAGNPCTVTLVGSNTLTSSANPAFTVWEEVTCTIGGSGSLTARSTAPGCCGIDLADNLSTLIIKDTATVTAVGTGGAINSTGKVLLGDNATLTMTNNSTTAKSRLIGRADTGGSGQWKLTGAATTGDPLTGTAINVSVPAGGTGTVSRTASYKQGDINGDGDVNVLDLSVLLANFGKSGAAVSDPRADINNDGDVNVLDLSILLANFGK